MKFGLLQYTLDLFFKKVIEQYSDRPSLALVGETPFTYWKFGQKVNELQDMLKNLGLRKQDKVILLGNSSPNWATAFMAVMTMGAVAVPVLEEFPEGDIDHIIRHSDATSVFIDDYYYKHLNLTSLKKINHIISLDDLRLLTDEPDSKPTILKQIQDIPDRVFKVFDKSSSDEADWTIEEDDLAEILYTSGTTGHSKGVMLTHKNLVSNLFEGPDLLGVINKNSIILSILPMAHAFGSTSAFLSIIYCGASIFYLNKPPSPKILLEAMQEVKPTILGAVPLIFEKIYHKQILPQIAANKVLNMLAGSAKIRKLLYKVVGKKVKKLLGGRLDCVIIGGASLSKEVEIFLQEGAIPYCCGYGLSECSPLVTFSSKATRKMGSPGHAILDVQIKIMDQDPESEIGEICVKGPNVMSGYYKNNKATENAFTSDGWFITGDQGYLDQDGYLFITGRSKNVIVLPSGENICPELVEAKLAESLFIEECLVYQLDNRLVARVYPDYNYIESLERGKDENRLAGDINAILENVRKDLNKKLPSFSKINQIIEQSSPFIKTPTKKIKRGEYVPGYQV